MTAAVAELAPVPASLRVLVVDDNADTAEALADVLEMWGHRARTAADGTGALTALRDATFDVVLLDITLPDFDGYEVARRLKSEQPDSPVRLIALSGHNDDDERGAALGFELHLRKPVAPERLEAILTR